MQSVSKAIGVVLLLLSVSRSEQAKGYVYVDANRNGKMDFGERGVPGVRVSNGREVVQTNHRGQYWIEVKDETILFITKPPQYDVPVNAQNLPQFYYIHYPQGTPNPVAFKYPVIQPTGPLPDYVNFPLWNEPDGDRCYKRSVVDGKGLRLRKGKWMREKLDFRRDKEDRSRFDALAFADPQPDTDEEIDFVREDVVSELVGTDARFAMVAGDVINDHLDLFPHENEVMGKIGVPIWNVPGNHDMNYDALDDHYATETYKSIFGPTYFSFEYGDVHFVGLDNVKHTGRGGYIGEIGKDQLEWLKNDLKYVPRHKLIVIYCHIPLKTDAGTSAGINTADLQDLFALLQEFKNIYSFSGHDTSNSWQMYLGPEHGWFGPRPFHHQVLAEVRGWNGPRDERGVRAADMADGNPNGYYVMSFDGAEYSARFKAANHGSEHAMRIVLDPPLASDGQPYLNRGKVNAPTKVVVNVFDGGVKNQVEMSLDGGPYRAMDYTVRNDPYMETVYARFQGTADSYARPEPSSHLWETLLPGNLTIGTHIAQVRSEDMYGRKTSSNLVFKILP